MEYQKEKARFLVYISHSNMEACAYLGTGMGNVASLTKFDKDSTRVYSDLLAEAVRAIGQGRASPTTYGALSSSDVSQIESLMIAQGISEAEAQNILSGHIGQTPDELCRAGVLENNALAAAPADIVAKVAFR
jgi:hypothetical protein